MPLYEARMDVCYRNDNEIQECKILSVHYDNLLEPYYTVRLLDGKEKQTENTHIMLRLQDGKKCSEEGMTHQDIAREQCAQRVFILRKQRMKKGNQTMKEKYRESLPPKKKAQILEDDATAHQHRKYQESFPLEKKAQILEEDAVAHQKYQESLPPKEKPKFWRIMLENLIY